MRNILYLLVFFFGFSAYAQTGSGIVTYKGVINQKYVDSFLTDLNQKDIPMNIKQGVADMYLNASEDEYLLHFKDDESYFYHNPTLAQLETYDAGSGAGTTPFYTNNTKEIIIEESHSLGKIALPSLEWSITSKTKNIGGYTCYQATATEELFSRKGGYYNREVIAWFAPEFPVNFGPQIYSGLPGLVLQVERDKFTITATNIELNPSGKDLSIKRLDEGAKVITFEEANERIKEMTAENERMYNN